MMDLIYGGKEIEGIMKKEYPDAKFIDASDDIHTERFEFRLGEEVDAVSDEYLSFMFKSGLFNLSLHVGLMMTNPGDQPRLDKIIKKLKEE